MQHKNERGETAMMKKMICILIVLALCLSAAPVLASQVESTKTVPNDGQNPVMNFIGNYVCDRARVEVMPKGDDSAQITVIWGSSAFDSGQWTMSGALDTDILQISYSDCTKKVISYDRDSEETDQSPEETIEYTNGSGTIIFGEDGTLTWNDDQEHIADGMVFEYIVNVNPAQEASDKVVQEQIEEDIIGTWMLSEQEGQPALTNEKGVLDIVSNTEAYISVSSTAGRAPWIDRLKSEININDNVITIAFNPHEGVSIVNEYTITDLSEKEFSADYKYSRTTDNSGTSVSENTVKYVRINDDFSDDIIGTWEGHCTSEGSVFDDGKEHRWEYKDDGTYIYYVKDGDDWVPGANTMNEYFVDGTLLCTRWETDGEEYREWWEISIEGDQMSWTALREDEDGKTFTATFEMKKVAD